MAGKTKKSIRMKQLAEQPQPKLRKKRKPMTAEQKAAAAERLAKARANRKKTSGPPKNVHPSVAALPDENLLSLQSVRGWIKHNKELLTEERRALRAGIKGAESKVAGIEGYIRNMEHYIRTGDWVDWFYGKEQQNKVRYKCRAMAYHFEGPHKGEPKRDINTIYPDVGLWTEEMHNEYYGLPEEPVKKTRKKRKKA